MGSSEKAADPNFKTVWIRAAFFPSTESHAAHRSIEPPLDKEPSGSLDYAFC